MGEPAAHYIAWVSPVAGTGGYSAFFFGSFLVCAIVGRVKKLSFIATKPTIVAMSYEG